MKNILTTNATICIVQLCGFFLAGVITQSTEVAMAVAMSLPLAWLFRSESFSRRLGLAAYAASTAAYFVFAWNSGLIGGEEGFWETRFVFIPVLGILAAIGFTAVAVQAAAPDGSPFWKRFVCGLPLFLGVIVGTAIYQLDRARARCNS